jgi:hypothetical protein
VFTAPVGTVLVAVAAIVQTKVTSRTRRIIRVGGVPWG